MNEQNIKDGSIGAEVKRDDKAEAEVKKRMLNERKKQKSLKKSARENRYILFDPDKMQAFSLSIILGYFFRFFSIGFSLFGVCFLVCDAFLLTDVNWLPLLIYCVGAVSAFSLIFIGRLKTLIGLGIAGGYVGLFYALVGNILTFYMTGTETLINSIMHRLSAAGFAAAGDVSLPYFGGLDEKYYMYGGVFALATVLALIFAAFSAKRTRLIPMMVFGGIPCVICFTYNFCTTNWGVACVFAGLCSAIVLSSYDKIYRKHKKSKKSRAYSGYAAALAGLLAMLVIVMPAASIKKEFDEIPLISEKIDNARLILTTILTGGNPKYNKMNTLNKNVSANLDDVEFTGAELFTISSFMSKRNVYLRSWIADDYNAAKNSWSVLDEDSYNEMKKAINGERTDFTGDDVTSFLYSLFMNEDDEYELNRSYHSDTTRGFVASYIDVKYVENTGLLYILPSAYDSNRGLLEFESKNVAYDNSATVYSDGILKSSWFNLKKSYSLLAYAPSYIESEYAQSAEDMAKYYSLLKNFINNGTNNIPESLTAEEYFAQILEENGITGYTGIISEYLALSTSQRTAWRKQYISAINDYSDYVKELYTSVEPTKGLEFVYNEVKDKVDAAATTHEKLVCIIDYLVENYTYSTTPEKPSGTYDNDLDSFLLETKNGYCVQFATAATLLFRMFDFPARYVQGYVASDFEKNTEEDANMPYISSVTDEDAHAWVEVYIEGLGWRTYEATPKNYLNLYEYKTELSEALKPYDKEQVIPVDTDVTGETTTPATETEPVVTEPVVEDPGADAGGSKLDIVLIIKIAVIILLALAVFLLIRWQIRRAKKIADGRNYYIERSIYGTFEDASDKNRVCGVICDSIYEIHYIIGNRPRVGEDPTQFAERIDHPKMTEDKAELRKQRRAAMRSNTLSEITVLLEKQEFGKAINREELALLGEYLKELKRSEYAALDPLRRLWYRYIRFMI